MRLPLSVLSVKFEKKVRERFLGFGLSEDYMSVNLAVPVEDAQKPQVHRLYKRIYQKLGDWLTSLQGIKNCIYRITITERRTGRTEIKLMMHVLYTLK